MDSFRENHCQNVRDCLQCVSERLQWITLLNQTNCCAEELGKLDIVFVSVITDQNDCPPQLSTSFIVPTVLGVVLLILALLCAGSLFRKIFQKRNISQSATHLSSSYNRHDHDIPMEFENIIELQEMRVGETRT
ncbi:unnamed protein product [Allacma fusca]|uniref:Uncharacterized protein n=1 Tax=Allacma fusca TaxID=39272 RepID=A0A8J2PFX4_9HEXA|nr:unnamed protein product [Allacma fusca]